MGQFYNIKCKKCGCEEGYDVGRGFIPLEPGAFEEIMSREEYEPLRSFVKGPEDLKDSCYKIFYCKDCKALENDLYFRLVNNPSFKFRHNCSKCGKITKGMLDINDLVTKKMIVNCRKCGAEDIVDSDILPCFWD